MQSTGSFFPDRSTSLGYLMGVTLPGLSASLPIGVARPPPRREKPQAQAQARTHTQRQMYARKQRPVTRWWRLCRDEDMGKMRRTSLGDFLQIERRLGYASGGVAEEDEEMEGEEEGMYIEMTGRDEVVDGGGVQLFKNGRVLPPASASTLGHQHQHQPRFHGNAALIRLTGICNGGEG